MIGYDWPDWVLWLAMWGCCPSWCQWWLTYLGGSCWAPLCWHQTDTGHNMTHVGGGIIRTRHRKWENVWEKWKIWSNLTAHLIPLSKAHFTIPYKFLFQQLMLPRIMILLKVVLMMRWEFGHQSKYSPTLNISQHSPLLPLWSSSQYHQGG